MGKRLLLVGAGGVGSVIAQKCAQVPEVFSEILVASRTLKRCEEIRKRTKGKVQIAEIDADNVSALTKLIKKFKPDLVLNAALPYQDLHIMDACLAAGVNYLDTANYEPLDEARFSYRWQWAYQSKFKKAGLMALLGCGFDPGVSGVFTAWLAKHKFDTVRELDIFDCNAGDHGKAFATNFNPEINIREVTQRGKYWADGRWVEIAPMSISRMIDYPGVGPKRSYLIFHEELESLAKHFPTLKRARFWMTFGDEYLTHLRVLQNVGMTRIDPVRFNGVDIVPLQFLKALLPDPASLAKGYSGKTSIGCDVLGEKAGRERRWRIYNICDHSACFREVGAQAVSYTTGVPAMVGALMMLTGQWTGKGVFNVEQMDPDPFLDVLGRYGLPWEAEESPVETAEPFRIPALIAA
ncbi:MAG: saccharopine dehydrogenase family protein [Elusimicrobia bacterium]|nr:saccharopine dehydrogenase family protein [Elusimicrobiota bacterium]